MELDERLEIEVTEEHIENGERYMGDRCPIALAVQEEESDLFSVAVGGERADVSWFEGSYTEKSYRLGPDGRAFVRAFDRGEDVEPCTVVLEVS